MRIRNTARWLPLVAGLLALPLAPGCGGASALLGRDSEAKVMLVARDISDLELIVSPIEGSPDAAGVCSDRQVGMGCTRVFRSDTTTFTFRTRSTASEHPYYVYVRNTAGTARTATIEVRMDDVRKVYETISVAGGATVRAARIYRNNAEKG
ncbi:MAG: hypothetical protein IT208_06825 [Chthonomonadales bacterium]|nr:hypothetical protein [Chthonomonadales bacterium]